MSHANQRKQKAKRPKLRSNRSEIAIAFRWLIFAVLATSGATACPGAWDSSYGTILPAAQVPQFEFNLAVAGVGIQRYQDIGTWQADAGYETCFAASDCVVYNGLTGASLDASYSINDGWIQQNDGDGQTAGFTVLYEVYCTITDIGSGGGSTSLDVKIYEYNTVYFWSDDASVVCPTSTLYQIWFPNSGPVSYEIGHYEVLADYWYGYETIGNDVYLSNTFCGNRAAEWIDDDTGEVFDWMTFAPAASHNAKNTPTISIGPQHSGTHTLRYREYLADYPSVSHTATWTISYTGACGATPVIETTDPLVDTSFSYEWPIESAQTISMMVVTDGNCFTLTGLVFSDGLEVDPTQIAYDPNAGTVTVSADLEESWVGQTVQLVNWLYVNGVQHSEMDTYEITFSYSQAHLDYIDYLDYLEQLEQLAINSDSGTVPGNYLPYFDPPMTGLIMIFKEPSPFFWSYPLPEVFDDNEGDIVTVTVDFSDAEALGMVFSKGSLQIEDISSEELPTGKFGITIELRDGVEHEIAVTQYVTIVVRETLAQDGSTSESSDSSGTSSSAEASSQVDLEGGLTSQQSQIQGDVDYIGESTSTSSLDDGRASTNQAVSGGSKNQQPADFSQTFYGFSAPVFTPQMPERKEDVTVKIKSPDASGVMDVQFSRNIRLPANATEWTDKNEGALCLSLQYQPMNETLEAVEGNNVDLQFSWRLKNLNKEAIETGRMLQEEGLSEDGIPLEEVKQFKIQLEFTHPLYVSQSISDLDSIGVEVLPEMFIFESNELSYKTELDGQIKEDGQFLVKVQRQLPGADAEAIESVTETTETSLIALSTSNIFMSYVFSGLIQFLWGMINTLQIIMPTALFSIMLPSNVQQLMFSLMSLCNFDLLNTETAYMEIFNFADSKPFNAIFEVAGYQSSNFVIESGTLLFVIIAFCLYQLIRHCLRLAARRFEENKVTRCLSKSNFLHSAILRFMLEGSLELGLAAFISSLNSENWKFNGLWESVSVLLGVASVVALLLTPVFIVFAGFKLRSKKATPTQKEKYAPLFEKLRNQEWSVYVHQVMFMLRRFAMIIILTLFADARIAQINCNLLAAAISFAYIWIVQPFDDRLMNLTETVNEGFILCAAYHLFIYTDYVADLETEYQLGWSLFGLILLNVAVNMGFFFYASITQCKQSARRKKAKNAATKAWRQKQKQLATQQKYHDAKSLDEVRAIAQCKKSARRRRAKKSARRNKARKGAIAAWRKTQKQLATRQKQNAGKSFEEVKVEAQNEGESGGKTSREISNLLQPKDLTVPSQFVQPEAEKMQVESFNEEVHQQVAKAKDEAIPDSNFLRSRKPEGLRSYVQKPIVSAKVKTRAGEKDRELPKDGSITLKPYKVDYNVRQQSGKVLSMRQIEEAKGYLTQIPLKRT